MWRMVGLGTRLFRGVDIMGKNIILNKKEQILFYRLCALRGALRLEIKGMKHSSGYSAYSRLKNEYGLTGNKMSVLNQINELIKEKKL